MRDIKFRCWNEHGEVMHDWGELVRLNKIHLLNAKNPTYKIMQFTGLKDKNGVEIYEGDIVKCNYFAGSKVKQHIEVVEFKNGKFELTWTINKIFKSFRSRSCFHSHSDAFEIIGNIHENPELLQETK